MRGTRTSIATAAFIALALLVHPAAAAGGKVRMAATTSVENSGLLAAILPEFERSSGLTVEVLPVGSGKALELGRRGDVDAILAHSPAAEKAFVADGFGEGRVTLMRNWFLIAGPPDDPAAIRGLAPIAAMRKLAESGALFISRGDESGTHVKEKELWEKAGKRPEGGRYLETGSGMSQTLLVAHEKGAYTLADRATFLFVSPKIHLVPLVERGDELLNLYSAMWIDPKRAPGVRVDGARKLVRWLSGKKGQAAIGAYRIADERVFEPLLLPRWVPE